MFDIKEKLELLSQCESSGRQYAINSKEIHGSSYGILQFRLETFNHFGKRYGLPHTDIFSKEQQFAIAKAMIEDGRGNHWACWRKLGLERFE